MSDTEKMLKAVVVEGAMPRLAQLSNMLLSAQGVTFIMDSKTSPGKLIDELTDTEPMIALMDRMRICLDTLQTSRSRNAEKNFMDPKEVHLSMKMIAELHYLGIKLSRSMASEFEDFANTLRKDKSEDVKDSTPEGYSMDDILGDFFPGMN